MNSSKKPREITNNCGGETDTVEQLHRASAEAGERRVWRESQGGGRRAVEVARRGIREERGWNGQRHTRGGQDGSDYIFGKSHQMGFEDVELSPIPEDG